MTPLLNNTSLIKQVDAVCHLYGREPVADDHSTPAFKEIPEVPEKFRFGQRVKGTGRLVQYRRSLNRERRPAQGQSSAIHLRSVPGPRKTSARASSDTLPGRRRMTGSTPERCAAAAIRAGSCSCSISPTQIFSPADRIVMDIVLENDTDLFLQATGSKSRRSIPFTVIFPSSGSYRRQSNLMSVVLPEPFSPTRAMTSPGFMTRFIPAMASFVPPRYEK